MNPWSNIEVSPDDPEICQIDEFEKNIEKIPDHAIKIRNLITRHEVCHFKFRQHIKNIKLSIENLVPSVIPDNIGKNHIQHGEDAWKNDTSEKSLLGQQYVWAVKVWLGEMRNQKISEKHDKNLELNVKKWLGPESKDKIRLARLLLARLTWNWKSLEELQHGGKYEGLEYQIIRIDICHYNFPAILDEILMCIGRMTPVEDFEGCGSYTEEIQKYLIKELEKLDDLLLTFRDRNGPAQEDIIKAWLLACLIKTLKEQAGLSAPVIDLGI